MFKSNNKSPVMFEINYCYDPITGRRECVLERKVDGCHSMKTINNITGFVLGKLLDRQFRKIDKFTKAIERAKKIEG